MVTSLSRVEHLQCGGLSCGGDLIVGWRFSWRTILGLSPFVENFLIAGTIGAEIGGPASSKLRATPRNSASLGAVDVPTGILDYISRSPIRSGIFDNFMDLEAEFLMTFDEAGFHVGYSLKKWASRVRESRSTCSRNTKI